MPPAEAGTGIIFSLSDVSAFSAAGTIGRFIRCKTAAAAFQENNGKDGDQENSCSHEQGFLVVSG